ncbi:hypothetical protein RDWZM_006581 [Blomia tropicalis]|uniref:Integrin beta n=1 Tax=Blomia tropicalis TaxID=40697 RepID=A0A9Q0M8F7_BLOTA|nr:hypothetical protein RDWZM_006581 [Blomia tropicalis]
MRLIDSISIIIILLFHDAHSHDPFSIDCSSARTCSECISILKSCKWCTWPGFKRPFRCNAQFLASDCPPNYQINPQVENIRIVENSPFSDDLNNPVQLRPQLVSIESRVGSSATVTINYKQAEDYPMDLYYLMDLSYTMLKHKNSVSRVGRKLAVKMESTTKDFRIGFGSFVDKETIPFATYARKEQIYHGTLIEYTHSFINHMPLTKNSSEFEDRVINAKIAGNLDSPEGTLDALMQVMVCEKEIGWRPQSDKIIVVATDEEFHYGGDGWIGGIIVPNDGKCRLQNGRYVGSEYYDYPTMAHVAEVAKSKKFNIVFSVHNNVIEDYRLLSDIIGSNARVALLTENDDSIADLIEEVYRNISTSVELGVEYKPDNVDIEIWTNCGLPNRPSIRTSICQFQGKIRIPFEIRIKLRECTNLNETITIDLKEICKCDCEQNGQLNSPKCSHNGTFSCGICTTCNGIRSGKTCECDPKNRSIQNNQMLIVVKMMIPEHVLVMANVFVPNAYVIQCGVENIVNKINLVATTRTESNVTGKICSNRGECLCGRCQCKQATAHGQFCQHCPHCDAPQYCEQILSCIPDYRRKFCLNETDIINEINVPIHVLRNQTNPCKIEKDTDCIAILSKWNYQMIDEVFESTFTDLKMDDDQDQTTNNWKPPQLEQSFFNYPCLKVINGCDVNYAFRLIYEPEQLTDLTEVGHHSNDRILNFKITPFRETCPQPVNLAVVGSSAFFSVMIIGLITICIWKILTEYLDRREYQHFLLEVDAANFEQSENPLYKDAKVQFRNPAFGLRDRTSRFFFNKK